MTFSAKCDDQPTGSPPGRCPGAPTHRSLFPPVPVVVRRVKGRKTPAGRGALIRRLRRDHGLTAHGAQLAANAGNWRFWGVTTADAAAVFVKGIHLPKCAQRDYPRDRCYKASEVRPYFSRRPMGYHHLAVIAHGLAGF